MNKTEFFDKLKNGAKWDVGVSIARTNPLPLDANSVFESTEDLENYIKTNPLAYPGQIAVVIGDTTTDAYIIGKEVGSDTAEYRKLASASSTGDVAADISNLQTAVNKLTGYFDDTGKAKSATQADNATTLDNHPADYFATKSDLDTEVKARSDADTAISGKIGDLTTLTTTEKGSIVGAVTEVKGEVGTKYNYTNIVGLNDAQGEANTQVYSKSRVDQIVSSLQDAINGNKTTYVVDVYDNADSEADPKPSGLVQLLTADGAADKYKLGDAILIREQNKPDYWISNVGLPAKDATVAEGSTQVGTFEITPLEAKVQIDDSELGKNIDDKIKAFNTSTVQPIVTNVTNLTATVSDNKTAADTGIKEAKDAAAKALTDAKAYTDGKVTDINTTISGLTASISANTSAIGTATTSEAAGTGLTKRIEDVEAKADANEASINSLKQSTASATGLAEDAAPTVSLAATSDGKLAFNFGIPKGAAGERGASIFVAKINVLSQTDVNRTDIVNGADVRVGDTIFDNNGDAYTVESVADTTVHVSQAIADYNIKGKAGAAATLNAGTIGVDITKDASISMGGTENARTLDINLPAITAAEFNANGALVFTTNIPDTTAGK